METGERNKRGGVIFCGCVSASRFCGMELDSCIRHAKLTLFIDLSAMEIPKPTSLVVKVIMV